MVLCLDHSEAALEIAECLTESLTIEKTPIDTKVSFQQQQQPVDHILCSSYLVVVFKSFDLMSINMTELTFRRLSKVSMVQANTSLCNSIVSKKFHDAKISSSDCSFISSV